MLSRSIKKKLVCLIVFIMTAGVMLPGTTAGAGAAQAYAGEPEAVQSGDTQQENEFPADTGYGEGQDEQDGTVCDLPGDEPEAASEQTEDDQPAVTLQEDAGDEAVPELTVDPSTDGEKTFTVRAAGLAVPEGSAGPVFAVWSDKSGQDDLKWYQGEAGEDGLYTAAVTVSEHKGAGLYHVSAYFREEGEKDEDVLARDPVAETTFKVTAASGKTSIVSVNGKKGTFAVKGSGITAPSGVKTVKFRIWCTANPDLKKTYTAEKRSDGTYRASVNVKKFKHYFGTYKVQMKITMKNGIACTMSTVSKAVKADGYIFAVRANKSRTRYRIRILGVRASSVTVNAWSKKNGQNDIRTYKAKQYKTGCWRCYVNTKYHVYTGTYLAYVYADGKKKGGVSFSAVKALSKAEKQAEARLDKTGRTLVKAFRWSVSMPYRSVNTGIIRNCDAMATYGFTNHCGNCGVMAATFYHMARRLGYRAHYVTGYVPLAGGGMGPHAWVEIVEDGRVWVYDPDFQHETGRNGFRIYYGCGGTWRYSAYSRVN